MIQRIVIHCTATPAGREVSKYEISQWHKAPKPRGNGWTHFGYHILVHIDGSVSNLQPLPRGHFLTNNCIANGAKGYNTSSLHVCYVGGIDAVTRQPADTRTELQKIALFHIVKQLQQKYGPVEVVGHHDLNDKKACPCFNAQEEYKDVK